MESQKGFNKNRSIFIEGILYHHRKDRMAGDNIFAQCKVLQVSTSKLVLPLFVIEYDLNYG